MKSMLSQNENAAIGNGIASLIMLGGFRMPATNPEGHGPSRDENIKRAIAQLDEALQIMDGLGDWPELGASLQGIIEALTAECTMPCNQYNKGGLSQPPQK